ncbi:MAG: RNA polymerase subunit sigma [Burkholderiales bacterium 66-5]|uniref:RNA polymerase sigma factor n=1 Tax=Comamonas badia TaxID=265291 RepID=UPI0004240A83|nr:MAG: RNA polymerase subunit sigma [Burkholderiales bacterium 66-5]
MAFAAMQLKDTLGPIGDVQLVKMALAGEKQAFISIMRRYNQLLFRTARSILKNDAEAEEALQDGYLRAWKALATFRADARLSTWLVRVVANEALGRLRRRHGEVIPLDAAMLIPDADVQSHFIADANEQPEGAAMREEIRKLLENRIDRLPDAYRTVFMLRAVQEMSVEEVAHALQIPEATVRTRFFRARGLLREGLASEIDVTLGDAFSFDGERCDRIVERTLERTLAEGFFRAA